MNVSIKFLLPGASTKQRRCDVENINKIRFYSSFMNEIAFEEKTVV